MQAVIRTGGKQYMVKVGQTLDVDLLGDAKTLELEALMTIDGGTIVVGTPFVDGIKVMADVIAETKGEKIKVLKFKAKKRVKKLTGHRQHFSQIKITAIGDVKEKKAEAKVEKPVGKPSDTPTPLKANKKEAANVAA